MNTQDIINELRASILLQITEQQEYIKGLDGSYDLLKQRVTGAVDGLNQALCIINEYVNHQPVNIRRDSEWQEWVVPGNAGVGSSYRTSDKQDAIDTAHAMYPGRTIKLNGKEV